MRYQGKLNNWNDDKGYGFVEPNGGGTRAFVHIKSFQNRARRPVNGDLIVYEQVKDGKGKYKAINVRFTSDYKARSKSSAKPKSRKLGSLVVVTFFIALAATVYLKLLPLQLLYWYVTVSALVFIVYAFDKSAAKHERWRTPESHLHFWSLIGGWPGAFYAQNKLRHKSSKRAFQQIYWVTVVANICFLIWLLSEKGQQFIGKIIG